MSEVPSQTESAEAGQVARRVELIVAQLDSLPTLPRIASQLLRLTRSDQSTTRQVIDLIKQDQAVTAKIMSMARRAGSGIRDDATTIDKCVLLMGLEAIRSAALSVKILEIFDPASGAKGGKFDLGEFWKHSLAVALACERLAKLMPKPAAADTAPTADELFVAGLLHDIGKAALHDCLPKSYAKVIEAAESSHAPLLALERKLLGIDHSVVGKRLGQRWDLPPGVIDAIWLHHNPPGAMPESVRNRGFAPAVHLADLIARELRLGYSGNYPRPADSSTVAAAMGIDADRLDEVRRWLPNELANRSELIGIDQLDSRDLYHFALKGANEELAKLNEKLLAGRSRLAGKERYFDVLGELSRRLRPGDRPIQVAATIAQLLAPIIGVPRLVVFSEAPNASAGIATDPQIEGVLFDAGAGQPEPFMLAPADGEVEGLTAARRAGSLDPAYAASQSEPGVAYATPADQFALFPLQGQLGWVHSQLSKPLALERCCLLPLPARGRWVGGLVFAATPGNEFVRTWLAYRDELLAVASAAGLALRTAQVTAEMDRTAEELAQSAEVCLRLQDQLVRQKALASVGMMAAGAGHELNNPLTVISGRSELLAADESDPSRREALEQIRANAQRASGIITELMDFAQPPPAKPQSISLAEFAETLVAPLRQSGIDVTVAAEANLPAAWADPLQLAEAVQEVLNNAQQAMAAQDSNRKLELKLAHAPLASQGGQLELTITDTGVGMDSFVLEHATDPFFSARQAGRGRGLGLARARRLIEHNGGSLRLESSPGVGTTVRITVPGSTA